LDVIETTIIIEFNDFKQVLQALHAVILDELRRPHEGVLARDGLRPNQFTASRLRGVFRY
jgi:hypothetical protein